jgi:uncharacterized membrane-anchored protein
MKTIHKSVLGILLVSLVQLAFPLLFIAEKEKIIETGKEYTFRIEPVDPYDFFQGRYVELYIPKLSYACTNYTEFKRNDLVYVEFKRDSIGSSIERISHEKSKDALKIKLKTIPAQEMHIQLPFKRFYLEENKAKRIEERLASTRNATNLVHVKIRNGDFVLTDISSNGISLITGESVEKNERE